MLKFKGLGLKKSVLLL